MSSAPFDVTCPAGTITGYLDGDVAHFHSIEYSHIPGDFDNPEPAPPRDQDAREPHPEKVALTITAPAPGKRTAALAPTLVYIHGGRYEHGSHEDPRAEGTPTAEAGIVHVQLDYRVGLPGLARFRDDEPNHYRAIEDLQLGLEWIQRNIESFGGDPTNVTVVGQSAGANAVLWLCRRDHYRGAFRRAVALSPGFPRESFEERKATLRQVMKKPITRSSLAAMSQEELAAGYAKFRKKYSLDMALGPTPLECGQLADVPLILASTRDEFYNIPATQKIDRSPFRSLILRYVAPRFGFPRNGFKPWYQVAQHMDKDRPMGRLVGDAIIRRWAAEVAEKAPGKTWMVEFTRSSGPALHCEELRPLFGDTELAQWLRDFVRTGEPGFEAYRPEHAIWEYNLDNGENRVAYSSLDYISAAFAQDGSLL
ncbi:MULTISPECIES: carboxylesterase family protein [Corynebacterium]|uniref:Carboxylic ester hydrolase n=1 Tax=Corynebacterium guaraldiae TaxID=3051103 RepID=A0ABY3CSJ9_9CORY|nr:MULTISPECIES: carboxylesterase family protein [Corynebacterium]HCT9179284.1 carboxylesterase/lipase family protein [Corynebacterium aurimucosum]MDK8897605.1 carboxylesterase family protein [Corynebacterium sp. MSK004]OFM34047.1 carboxylesterase [Corynebacterium sp. HMSC072A02]OFP86569.1 carboxylesterase [Corynebacterium sp. HMSC059E07]TRX41885.1 carboxylesterase/lipase family protein [Corynebacterium guaraldiae]